MATTRSVKLKLVYEDATSRIYTFNGVEQSALSGVKNKVKQINIGLLGETLPTFAQTFVSNNGSPCVQISEAQIITLEQEVVYSAS
ncbi:hypothetical protein IJH02_01580 [Candidatus Saccharibacteria bacterium]|nr:hypothetical protein [Candidatus Saccharibacteria bacterium]